MSQLSARFEPDTDGTGEFFVQVEHEGFRGAGSAWFQVSVLIEFARKLENTYPFPPDARFELNGGHLNSPEGTIKELHVGLAVYPVGTLGDIGLKVHLESKVIHDFRPDAKNILAVEMFTSYEPLRAFARQLQAMISGNIEFVRLQANDF